MQRFRKLTNSPGGAGAGVSGLTTADGGNAIADNEVIRGDGGTGIQGSDLTLADVAGASVTLATTAGNALVINATAPVATIGASQVGKNINITASNAVASTDTDGAANGGALTITTGNAARRNSGDGSGGRLTLTTGSGIGAPGYGGDIYITPNTSVNGGATYISEGAIYTKSGIRINNGSVAAGSSDANNPRFVFASNIGLAQGIQLKFSTSHNAENALDQGLGYGGEAGSLIVTNGSSGIGGLFTKVVVEANTAVAASPNLITANESRKVFTNEGATAQNYHTLPSAVAGYQYTFINQDSDGIRIVAQAGDTIRIGASVSAGGGYCESIGAGNIGSTVTLTCINATEWIATSVVLGAWTVV